MTKWVFGLLVILVLLVSACTLDTYLPEDMVNVNDTNMTDNGTIEFDDIFEFVNETTNETATATNETDDLLNSSEEDLDLDTSLVLMTITVTEGEIASLASLQAEDPDGDTISFTFSEPFNEQGLWQTNDGDAGKYLVTVKASDGVLSTTEQIQLVVLATNKGPVIDCPSKFEVHEEELIDLPCLIFDREGDEVTFTVSGFMDELTYQTSYGDAGAYAVVIAATDGQRTTVKEINLSILEQNQLPIVQALEPITVQEGETVRLNVIAEDPDGDELTMTYPLLFDSNGNWKTVRGDSGLYELEAIVSDGEDSVSVELSIVVEKINFAPTIEAMESIEVNEGETITLEIEANDEDGDELEIVISGFMNENTYETAYNDEGDHWVLITVSDATHSVEENVSITVNNVNRPPVFVLN